MILFLSFIFYAFIFFIFWLIKSNSILKKRTLEDKKSPIAIFISLLLTICICVLPMGASPIWNGDIPEHRNQYELIADSIIEGKISLNYEVDSKLLEMDNPYNPQEREKEGVHVHWDSAYYNGKYYMYFGIIPALILFVPYKLITGHSLVTYHATQIFTSFFIIGLFSLFAVFAKKSKQSVNLMVYIFMSTTSSIISVWYISEAPSLYCTAISSGLCMMVWSLFFFYKAVYLCKRERETIAMSIFGSLFGAMTFGCRPPIGIANILAIPMYIDFINNRKNSPKLKLYNVLVFIPYVLIFSENVTT